MSISARSAQKTSFTKDRGGAIRVGGTRVPLERVIFESNAGASPEGIVESFPMLDLGDVCATTAYYLYHTAEVDAYIRERADDAARVKQHMRRRFPKQGLRRRLLARLHR